MFRADMARGVDGAEVARVSILGGTGFGASGRILGSRAIFAVEGRGGGISSHAQGSIIDCRGLVVVARGGNCAGAARSGRVGGTGVGLPLGSGGFAEFGEAEEEGGGLAGGFGAAEVHQEGAVGKIGIGVFGGVRGGGSIQGVAGVGVEMVEEVRTGGDNFDELGLGAEAGAPSRDGVRGGEPRGDFGEGHPEREGFGGAAEDVGDIAEGVV